MVQFPNLGALPGDRFVGVMVPDGDATLPAQVVRGVKGASVMRRNRLEVGQLGRPEGTTPPNSLPNWIAFVVVGAVSLVILLLGEGLMKAGPIRLNSGPGASGNVVTAS
jgi:hypothetical protein